MLLTVFAQSNFVADFLRDTKRKQAKNGHFAFFDPLWGLKAGYGGHLRLIGKHVVDFLLVITELFSLRFPLTLYAVYRLEIAVFEGVGNFGPKFPLEGDIPHQPFVQ